jgi:RNA binding exosome subunit
MDNNNELNLNLKLLKGNPIKIDNVGTLYPVKMSDIVDITIEKYNLYLNILCVESEDIKKNYNILEDISTFQFICLYCIQSDEYKNIVIDALKFFFKDDVSFEFEEEVCKFYLGDIQESRSIGLENFEEIKYIIKKLNCLVSENEEKEKYNPVNERAREILEKFKKDKETRERINKKESAENGDSLNLFDLVSILAGYGNGINVFNVWDLTFFQFNNQFNRMKILKDYEVNIQILMNTTEPDKVKYQHWLSKIVKE